VLPLLGLFPCTFFLANLGAGAPMIITLHAPDPSTGLVLLDSLVSIGFALALIWVPAGCCPHPRTRPPRWPAPAGRSSRDGFTPGRPPAPPQRVAGFLPRDVAWITRRSIA
jgi:hypothetical protein